MRTSEALAEARRAVPKSRSRLGQGFMGILGFRGLGALRFHGNLGFLGFGAFGFHGNFGISELGALKFLVWGSSGALGA